MDPRFPAIEPYDAGMLDVGDGHQVYWECSGNPNGRPALFVHGGPGAGCSANQRRFFDPETYRIVLFDQRGCGRSRPLASAPDAGLSANTTAHLIADIELLRALQGVGKWTVLGVSWGCTLALAYAQAYPAHVDALVLALVTTTSRREVRWGDRGCRAYLSPGVGSVCSGRARGDARSAVGGRLCGAPVRFRLGRA
jgi:proline iminopeptidase